MSTIDQYGSELCHVLIKDLFGPVVSKIAQTFLSFGRLDFSALVKRSNVSSKLVRQALVVMIQHHLVGFTAMTSLAGESTTYYEIKPKEVLTLLRAGQEVLISSQEISPEAAAIVKVLLLHGRMRAGDILQVFNAKENASIDAVLTELVQRKFLRVAMVHQMMSEEELRRNIRQEELQKMSFPGTASEAKKTKEVEMRLHKRLSEIEQEAAAPEAGLKRKSEASSVERASKKRKVGVASAAGDMKSASEFRVDPNTILRVNHDKFTVLQRNQDLVRLATKRLGSVAGEVYKHVLKSIEGKIHSCKQDVTDIVLTTLSIGRAIPKEVDLESCWTEEDNGKKSKSKSSSSGSRKKGKISEDALFNKETSETEAEEELGESGSDEAMEENSDGDASDASFDFENTRKKKTGDSGERLKLINRFLDTFASDSLGLLRKVGSRNMGEWQVDYLSLSELLRTLEVESVVFQKFGDIAARLFRIVKDKRKVDEKQLATLALLKQKDIRALLTSLHEVGMLDLQEVPKRADRQPSMTFFLWHHRPERTIPLLVCELNKAMARTHIRLSEELNMRRRLLEKSQRTDVSGREAEYLSKEEVRELRRVKTVEERMLALSGRMDRMRIALTEY